MSTVRAHYDSERLGYTTFTLRSSTTVKIMNRGRLSMRLSVVVFVLWGTCLYWPAVTTQGKQSATTLLILCDSI